MKNKLAIIGVGSAGILSLCHFLSNMDETWEITSIHNPSKKIQGIGESSNPSFLNALERGLGFEIVKDLDKLNGTLKFGTKYTDWRSHEFINPLLGGFMALHFDTHSLYSFAMGRLTNRWGNKFKIIKGNVNKVENNKDEVKLKIDNIDHSFDFVIDCGGTPKSFKSYKMGESLLNTCLVHNTEPSSEPELKHTGHIATKNGWLFRVPLKTRTSYGYMYNTTITTDKEAKKNFSDTIGIPVKDLQKIKYKFKPYYTEKALEGRVLKNGNAVAFFEPMFANSLFIYDTVNREFWEHLVGAKQNIDKVNKNIVALATNTLSLIAFHYLGGSTYSTKFWRRAKKWGKKETQKSNIMEYHNRILDGINKNSDWVTIHNYCFAPHSFAILARNLGYTKKL